MQSHSRTSQPLSWRAPGKTARAVSLHDGGGDAGRHRHEGLPETELFTPGHYAWTGKNTVVTYLGANTASHYRTAAKILKRWQRERAK